MMCVSINGPADFDLETGMRVASKTGNLCSKFGVLELFTMYSTDGWMDGQTDGQKQCLLSPSLLMEHNKSIL